MQGGAVGFGQARRVNRFCRPGAQRGRLRRVPRVDVRKVLLDDLPRLHRDVAKDLGRDAEPRGNRKARPLQADQVGGFSADGVW